jgi:diaminohydroxyphosphoribosylaminopyrimidine deaminase / 5-amino-6-(5-phosphoribosylamino)uracil reductase
MPASTSHDDRFMSLALALGRRGLGNTWPNPAVGAVVVRFDGGEPVVVGRGWTQPGGRPHAETEALRRAGEAARGATLYVTLEPCSHYGKTPPCAEAVIAAGIARVVTAIEDPNAVAAGGHAMLRAHGITVDVGTGAADARRDLAGHLRRVRDHRPHVFLKLAVSADGKAGLAGRRPAAITGEAARDRVHMMRAMNDAILTGIGTVLSDDPQLTCRLPGMAARSPVRVVLDASLRLPLTSALVRSARETPVWVLTGDDAPADAGAALAARGVEVFRLPASGSPGTAGVPPAFSSSAISSSGAAAARAGGTPAVPGLPRLDLFAALRLLADRGITRLMAEAGPIVAAAFLAADLVDAAALLRGPAAIGAGGIDALEGMPLTVLTASPQFRARGNESVGADTIEIFERNPKPSNETEGVTCSPAS